MAEYLTKEEIKQWRSSLEKITLEEYAARLGKKIEEKKVTNDLVDIVLHGKPVVSTEGSYVNETERLSSIANRAYEKEKELYISPFSVKNLKDNNNKVEKKEKSKADKSSTVKTDKIKQTGKTEKTPKSELKPVKKSKKNILSDIIEDKIVKDEIQVIFKKSLTDREQRVFDYFTSHQNEVVYAKDLANLLELPRDYVYKYIKNLRAKIEGDALQNADKGGFIFVLK